MFAGRTVGLDITVPRLRAGTPARCGGLIAALLAQRRAVETPGRPRIELPTAVRLVEAMGRLVPVEDGPLDPPISALVRDRDERVEQLAAIPLTPELRADVQVLDVEAVPARPGRERAEPQRETDGPRIITVDVSAMSANTAGSAPKSAASRSASVVSTASGSRS